MKRERDLRPPALVVRTLPAVLPPLDLLAFVARVVLRFNAMAPSLYDFMKIPLAVTCGTWKMALFSSQIRIQPYLFANSLREITSRWISLVPS